MSVKIKILLNLTIILASQMTLLKILVLFQTELFFLKLFPIKRKSFMLLSWMLKERKKWNEW